MRPDSTKAGKLALSKATDFLKDYLGREELEIEPNLIGFQYNDIRREITAIVNYGRAKNVKMPADIVVTVPYDEVGQ